MRDETTLPIVTDAGRHRVSTVAQLADIPEEEIWLQKQKSARTRRAYRLDVQMGEGVLAYFGYPRAHEDDAEHAVRAGLDCIDAVGRLDVGVRSGTRLGRYRSRLTEIASGTESLL